MKRITLVLSLVLLVLTNGFAQKEITLADLWQNWTFYQRSVNGLRSMNDGKHYTATERGGKIVKYSYETGEKVAEILDFSKLGIDAQFSDYSFNNDESLILLETNAEAIYRRSYTADYYVYNVATKKVTPLSENGAQQLATFSPDSKKVAFARKNNLFIKDLQSGAETQITTDGEWNKIINGVPDWVYEEEFEYNQAFHWSADSKKLAYVKFDESNVKMFGMVIYKGLAPELTDNALYPEYRTWKYPKAGEANSVVTVHVYSLDNKKTNTVDIGNETDIYIPRLRWSKDANQLAVMRLNRLQNKLEILMADAASGKSQVIYTDENKYYIDEKYFDDFQFLADGKHFVISSEKSGYNHLYLYQTDGKFVRAITSGNWDVTHFLGFDHNKKRFYYEAADLSPIERHVYSVDFKGNKKKAYSAQNGMNRAAFSATFDYYINYFSDINTPRLVTLHNASGKQIRVLQDNANLKKTVAQYGGSHKKLLTFKTSENVELYAKLILPPNFDENKKYPLLIQQYSGPNSQSVANSWSFDWFDMLAQNGYVVAVVDPRGTGARGEEFRKITYLQLGKYETVDMIEAAKYFGAQTYIDKDRIGIWGWSYGGYMALNAITQGADYFKMAIAVAPVTNWRYYDNIYTERFMRTPQENGKNYDANSPISHVDKLKGKLLIIHGTADDNVHFQNTLEFNEALIQAGKQFVTMPYVNRNHGMYGGNSYMHLYRLKTDFILQNL